MCLTAFRPRVASLTGCGLQRRRSPRALLLTLRDEDARVRAVEERERKDAAFAKELAAKFERKKGVVVVDQARGASPRLKRKAEQAEQAEQRGDTQGNGSAKKSR